MSAPDHRPTDAHVTVCEAIRTAACPDGGAPDTDAVLATTRRLSRCLTRIEAVRALEDCSRDGRVYRVGDEWRVRE